MRLLVIEPGLKLWGSEQALLASLPELAAANKTVVVMVPPDAELVARLRSLSVTIELAPIGNLHRAGRLAKVRAAVSIIRACRKHQIEKIYLNQAGLCRIIYCIASLLRMPLAIHIRLIEDIDRCARLPNKPWIDLIHISQDMSRRQHMGRHDAKRLVTVYDPFVLSRRGTSETIVSERDFCCVGRLAEIKGQVELIEGIAIARARGFAGKLDIIGTAAVGDPYEIRLKQHAAPLIKDGTIRFLGYRTDIADLMCRYRFVAVPSHYEPLGRVVMEAWDNEALPICSNDAGGCSEIVSASDGGIRYDGHTPEAIAEAILFAIAMPEADRHAAIERGRAWARKNLSLEAYRRILAGVIFPVESSADDSIIGSL